MIKIGTLIAQRYEVIKHAGNGGMQYVYRARDTLLDIDVALKTPQPGQQTKGFKLSAQIAARINHHDVAKTLDYFQIDGIDYLVEEFIEGENLEQKLAYFQFLDPHLAARVLHHLAKGLAASHRVGVIHRDLKPSNVMVSGGVNLHHLKITDFGIATLTKEFFDDAAQAGDLTKSNSGTIKGAIPYMAPEMMFRKAGEKITEATDIWSLGAMMFRLLTGEYPFGVFLDAAVNVKTKNRVPWPGFMTSNRQLTPLALQLQALVEKCLSYNPNDRPTASEISKQCQDLCYLSVEREIGTVQNLIQNNYSGFAQGPTEKVFFSMDSVYGPNRPNPTSHNKICYSSFAGHPKRRAHPILLLRQDV
ncbi:serine/threonine-protein kinase [Janthinobacterium sp. FW305-128]|uniref:serine/threonine-protein kinase n=1 Tax=Janthinobacterium sp. FW305-128 TaxID=2775055 RepID=UPI001E553F83|nr:serine/threonine-protein kinase [Janthinobacterium sp. FW305-128]MCC7679902.1 serine/threonine protein kinase [Janthinobacterium sp. FW305-128]